MKIDEQLSGHIVAMGLRATWCGRSPLSHPNGITYRSSCAFCLQQELRWVEYKLRLNPDYMSYFSSAMKVV